MCIQRRIVTRPLNSRKRRDDVGANSDLQQHSSGSVYEANHRAGRSLVSGILASTLAVLVVVALADYTFSQRFQLEDVLAVPFQAQPEAVPTLRLVRNDHVPVQFGKSAVGGPLILNGKELSKGIGAHSSSHIEIRSPSKLRRLVALVGINNCGPGQIGPGSVRFAVRSPRGELYRSPILRSNSPAMKIELSIEGERSLELLVDDGDDGPNTDHAVWGEARLTDENGQSWWIDDLPQQTDHAAAWRFPFSFSYGGRSNHQAMLDWEHVPRVAVGPRRSVVRWRAPDSGLEVSWEIAEFPEYRAVEWYFRLENRGEQPTPVISDWQSLDLLLNQPLSSSKPYRLHTLRGAGMKTNAEAVFIDYEPQSWILTKEGTLNALEQTAQVRLGGELGRSSNRDFPFMHLETGAGTLFLAVGWSGQWLTDFAAVDHNWLRIRSGLECTRFRLLPGEQVRMPRILLMQGSSDVVSASNQFRQLIYHYYSPRFRGEAPLPRQFHNTCFSRGGMWLNETTAANQISLVRAYSRLGVEAVFTDAGWFKGGFGAGVGNYTPDPERYPEGIEPIARAAHEGGVSYGLWFASEQVVHGTELHRAHPQWLLAQSEEPAPDYLLNYGIPAARKYMNEIVDRFMQLPGFAAYRQDLNQHPLEFWRRNDAPDRQGITELKYIAGLYDFWDTIRERHPGAFLEGCSGGGRRIDLETIMRFHVHQKSDHWFDPEFDQSALSGLAMYLPNHVIVNHSDYRRLDDYSFHSAMDATLCAGWAADAADFDVARAKQLLERHAALRHLFIGDYYALLPPSYERSAWVAKQYHRPDLNEGVVVVFRREQSPYSRAMISLHGLNPDAHYVMRDVVTGETQSGNGRTWMEPWEISLVRGASSIVWHYKGEPPAINSH
jgi:alpha-galactosidase